MLFISLFRDNIENSSHLELQGLINIASEYHQEIP